MRESNMEQMWQSAHLQGGNLSYVEELYEAYLLDPHSIPEQWRSYFEALPKVNGSTQPEPSYATIEKQFLDLGKRTGPGGTSSTESVSVDHEKKQVRVLRMINAYRFRGHQKANLDPLELQQRDEVPDLNLGFHELTSDDHQTEFRLGSLFFGPSVAPLHEIVRDLEKTYCSNIGFEFMHAVDTQVKRWFQQRIEPVRGKPEYSEEVKKDILLSLTAAEGLEKYLGSRYPGTKRFGLEGGESLIPMIEELINRGSAYGAQEFVIGMAHRGRLNVLVNILGKKPSDLFEEFEGKSAVQGSGDVKYHQGFSSNWISPHGEVHLALSFNPSHLEVVSPVVEGSVRARQDRRGDEQKKMVVPVVVHGDAAFAGQGVVMEVFQMSQTRGFYTGGTIHVILNNQVGFTTSRPDDARSTEYCTDVAKMLEAPILHVNGDDPEAVMFATQLAMDYRNEFNKDVVIDLVCYRRRGHNEADEPSSTQPMMYKVIKKHRTTRELYAEKLAREGVLSIEQSDALMDDYRNTLDEGGHLVEHWVNEPNFAQFVDWTPYLNKEWTAKHDTRVDIDRLRALGRAINTVPEDIVVQRQVAKIYKDRMQMVEGDIPVDWGCAEALAYATLINSGHPVRLTGQDVGRGTFSHRHAVLHSQTDGVSYIPLQHIAEGQPAFDIYDSLLSEMAVVGFEYGYATTSPQSLTIWEAQFGDFANNAQVVIDQFITSGEHKWSRLCGLTMFLPHGYEGQGPEHSSARLERFMQLCAEHNIQVCLPTTPSQVFHMLRRQIIRPLRKPLIVMTAKSLLRHKHVISSMEELADGTFQTVLPEYDEIDSSKVTRAILCSGKIYYELLNKRREDERQDLAIIRIEQLYPFPEGDLAVVLEEYTNLTEVTWVQEEPLNQGVWYSSQHHMRRTIARHKNYITLGHVAREASAAPAVGHMGMHQEQQQKVIDDAINP